MKRDVGWILIVLLYVLVFFSNIDGAEVGREDDDDDLSFAVAMTTIPPRFSSVTPTLLSWMNQKVAPLCVYIFIPTSYKRFRRKNTVNKSLNEVKSYSELLIHSLRKNNEIKNLLDNGFVKVLEIERDWGPASRFMGILQLEEQRYQGGSTHNLPKYWLVGDDDVFYNPATISNYKQTYLKRNIEVNNKEKDVVLSQFVEDFRVAVIRPLESNLQLVPHVQGVDTYVIPTSLLHRVSYNPAVGNKCTLSFSYVASALDYLHQTCEESFYQDDYVISFLLFANDIPVKSIWKGESVANHIDNVSKSNFQMHMSPLVFDKEQATKACISTYSTALYHILCPSL